MTDIVGFGQFLDVANSINGSDKNINDRRPMNVQVELLAPNYTEYKIEIQDLSPLNDTIINNIKNDLIAELNKKKPITNNKLIETL